MRPLPTGLAALLLLTAAGVSRADDQAQEAIKRAMTAMGGEETLKKQSSMSWDVQGKMVAFGQTMPYTATYSYQAPNKLRFDMAMNFMGQDMKLVVMSNGQKAWESANGQEQEMPAAKFKEFQHTAHAMYATLLWPLKDPAFKLASLGESQEEGKTLVGVKVSKEGQRDVSLFFDKTTGLIHKSTYRAHDEFNMKEVQQDVYFENYVEQHGLKYFTKLTIKRDGQPFLEEILSNQKLQQFDAKFFEKQ